MEELLATDGTMSDNEELATEGTNLDEVDEGATSYEEVDLLDDEETESVEEVELPKPQPEKKNKVAKILSERNEAKRKADELARENALLRLEKTQGEFNHDDVKVILDNNPTLSEEDAVLLWKAKNKPKVETRKPAWIVGTEARTTERVITDAQLKKLNDDDYARAMELIQLGKMKYTRG